ncbi:hypothetical protein [Lactobacillus sp. LL6]|uniref:hypothetical protein n=1 Tax=Lactobacillus sp. LL6 TaxID=2596827 RepID=UPI001185C46C|nr:hypothetical protein [Lactobacillus sp. LL6]TSO26661.1 hypothetical protein FOD82_06250 [Lactobacillus sp. LL6]
MKKYRPNTTAVVVGIVLMVIGLIMWLIRAAFNQNSLNWLIIWGLLCVCCGGLELTIVAFIALRKNDLEIQKQVRAKEAQEKKDKQK